MGSSDNELSQAWNIKPTVSTTKTIGPIQNITVLEFPRTADHYRTQAIIFQNCPLITSENQFQWWFS